MESTVVVTLRDRAFNCDFELPWNFPLLDLSSRLREVLKTQFSEQFAEMKELHFKTKDGYLSDESKSLRDYGVNTGAYLDLDWR